MIRLGRPIPRWIWLSLTWAAIGLGAAGAVLPVLPTTPFLLFALWSGSRASPRLRFRLYRHPRYGATLRAWQRHGVIPVRAKCLAGALMATSAISLWLLGARPALLAGVMILFLFVLTFILTRPSRVNHVRTATRCQPVP